MTGPSSGDRPAEETCQCGHGVGSHSNADAQTGWQARCGLCDCDGFEAEERDPAEWCFDCGQKHSKCECGPATAADLTWGVELTPEQQERHDAAPFRPATPPAARTGEEAADALGAAISDAADDDGIDPADVLSWLNDAGWLLVRQPEGPPPVSGTATREDDLRTLLWDTIAGVRDAAPRVPNDASTDDIVEAVLLALGAQPTAQPADGDEELRARIEELAEGMGRSTRPADEWAGRLRRALDGDTGHGGDRG